MTTYATQLCTSIGGVVVAKAAYDFTSFLYTHLISPAKYHRFLYGNAPYALVTGATDGIGKAVAKELYNAGFNLVIHGRNLEKLRNVQQDIKGNGTREILLWVADASAAEVDFASAVKQWENIEITLVIHNVGGTQVRPHRIDGVPEDVLMADLRKNATFPWLLSRAILPKLRHASGPAEMVFVGSSAADLPVPFINPYSATKAFLRQISITLAADERFGKPSNVSTVCLMVGSVVSQGHRVDVNLFSPSSETFAKHVLNTIGCGKLVAFPYMWHAVQMWSIGFMPASIVDKTIADFTAKELEVLKKD